MGIRRECIGHGVDLYFKGVKDGTKQWAVAEAKFGHEIALNRRTGATELFGSLKEYVKTGLKQGTGDYCIDRLETRYRDPKTKFSDSVVYRRIVRELKRGNVDVFAGFRESGSVYRFNPLRSSTRRGALRHLAWSTFPRDDLRSPLAVCLEQRVFGEALSAAKRGKVIRILWLEKGGPIEPFNPCSPVTRASRNFPAAAIKIGKAFLPKVDHCLGAALG